MGTGIDFHAAKAALEWQIELGADEAICDNPVNRYEVKPVPRSNLGPITAMPVLPVQDSAPDIARIMAGRCQDLAALRSAVSIFEHCTVKQGARNTVFCDGRPDARVMVIGEAPGRDEDVQGVPFVGAAGQLLDKMFAAIGMARGAPSPADAIYITNVMPWRPPQNRTPTSGEIEMMLPFLARHVALVNPDVLVLMGNTPCQAVLGQQGINRLHGRWTKGFGKPVLPMFHPAYLLRDASKKRAAWEDLLKLQAWLKGAA